MAFMDSESTEVLQSPQTQVPQSAQETAEVPETPSGLPTKKLCKV